MRSIKRFLLLLLFSTIGWANEPYELIIDRYLSPYMGGEMFLTLHKSLSIKEDALFFSSQEPKRGLWPALGRWLELELLWRPINQFAATAQHEIFGHGYRARSLPDAKAVKYTFDWPAPYGPGGGATRIAYADNIKIGQVQSITVAGLEAEDILARQLKLKWLHQKSIAPKEASLYTTAQLSALTYTLITCLTEKEEGILVGNDIQSYLNCLNLMYPTYSLNAHQLLKSLSISLVDPMLYYAVYAQWKYIFTGQASGIPMIHWRDSAFLPNISVSLAPYGLEYYLENYLLTSDRWTYFYMKGGVYGGLSYYGCGIEKENLLQWTSLTLGLRFDSWYQPNFQAYWTLEQVIDNIRPSIFSSQLAQRKPGASFSIISKIRMNNTLTFFYSDIGYKTSGYLPGFPLAASTTVRLGMSAEF